MTKKTIRQKVDNRPGQLEELIRDVDLNPNTGDWILSKTKSSNGDYLAIIKSPDYQMGWGEQKQIGESFTEWGATPLEALWKAYLKVIRRDGDNGEQTKTKSV